MSFTATIRIINGNPYVRPPETALAEVFRQAGRTKGPIPVRGKLNGAPFQQSLVRYQGDWRLYVNGQMARRAGLEYRGSITAIAGREVQVEMRWDRRPPKYAMIPQLQKALEADRTARAAYERLAPGRRKEILRYLGFLRTAEARERNVQRILRHLRGEKADALYPLMRRKPETPGQGKRFATIDDYIASRPTKVQAILRRIRQTVRKAVPDAVEKISYQMPSFHRNGKYLVYYAAWKDYISLYPLPSGSRALERALSRYGGTKGSVHFPLAEPIPYDLVRRIVQRLAQSTLMSK